MIHKYQTRYIYILQAITIDINDNNIPVLILKKHNKIFTFVNVISTKMKCNICIPVLKMILTLKQNTHIVCFHNRLSFFMLILSYVYIDFWYKKRFLNVDWLNANTLKFTRFTRNFNCKRTVINIACISPTSKTIRPLKTKCFFLILHRKIVLTLD